MTTRDYELIALIINNTRDECGSDLGVGTAMKLGIDKLALNFSRAFLDANPRFSVDIFLKACGIK